MRIISQFRDFYDHLQAYYQEPGLVWHRAQSIQKITGMGHAPKRSDIGVMFFDKNKFFTRDTLGLFPVIVQYGSKRKLLWNLQKDWKDNYFETVEEVVVEAKDTGHLRPKINLARVLNKLEDYLMQAGGADAIFVKTEALLSIARVYCMYRVDILENPPMYEFSTFLEPQEIFQEISMALSTRVSIEKSKEDLQTPMNEQEKLLQHGMDKASFKKPKKQKGARA